MKKTEFKTQLKEMINQLEGFADLEEKLNFVSDVLIDLKAKNESISNISNKGKPWTDEELEIILSAAPTKENCVKYARLYKRGYGSIEQIYRWAGTQSKLLAEKDRENDAFIMQIHRIKKKLGLRREC